MFAATNLPSYKTSHFLSLKIVILLKTLLRFQNLSPAFLMQRDLTWFHLILKICSRLLESLYLFKTRPNLDDMQSASKLLTSIDKSLDFILVVRGWFFVCLMICNFIIDVFSSSNVFFIISVYRFAEDGCNPKRSNKIRCLLSPRVSWFFRALNMQVNACDKKY